MSKLTRIGSHEVKQTLVKLCPRCCICGSQENLTLHHIYLIRHGFTTKLNYSTLLCEDCHKLYHVIFDIELDELFAANPFTDFKAVFEQQIDYIRYLSTR